MRKIRFRGKWWPLKLGFYWELEDYIMVKKNRFWEDLWISKDTHSFKFLRIYHTLANSNFPIIHVWKFESSFQDLSLKMILELLWGSSVDLERAEMDLQDSYPKKVKSSRLCISPLLELKFLRHRFL